MELGTEPQFVTLLLLLTLFVFAVIGLALGRRPDLKGRLKVFPRVFIPHKHNDWYKKFVAGVLVLIWGIIKTGAAFNFANPSPFFFLYLQPFVLFIIASIWGEEYMKYKLGLKKE